MRLAVRAALTSRVVIADRLTDSGGWRETAQCEPISGYGRVALVQAGNTTVLAARDGKGRVRLSAGSGRPGPWQGEGVPFRGAIGMVQDAKGRTAVVTLGIDGKLSSTRHEGSGTAFTAWLSHDGRAQAAVRS
ncbi:hypothetical protein ACFQ2B_29635 [Streptomyces stramineus]